MLQNIPLKKWEGACKKRLMSTTCTWIPLNYAAMLVIPAIIDFGLGNCVLSIYSPRRLFHCPGDYGKWIVIVMMLTKSMLETDSPKKNAYLASVRLKISRIKNKQNKEIQMYKIKPGKYYLSATLCYAELKNHT